MILGIRNISPQKSVKSGYIIYARKSSESEDKQLASIDDQLAVLNKLAQERKLYVEKEFTESMSAKAPGRPVFNEMLEYVKAHGIKGIICWKVNRLFRNPKDEGTIRWLLQNDDIEEIVTPSKIYLEADSDFLMAVEGAQASRFIKDLRSDTKRGVQKKLDAGNAPILAPAGYFNDTRKSQGARTIEPDPVYFPLMRSIFDMALTGNYTVKRLYDIASELGLKNSLGKTVSRTRFYIYISNPVFYTGRFVFGGIVQQGTHKRMITDEEYELLVKMYNVRTVSRTEDTSRAYNGVLRCSCGNWMTGSQHKKNYKNGTNQTFIYYRCVHCKNSNISRISLTSLEEQIVEYLSRCALNPRYVELYVKWLNIKNTQQKELREARKRQLDRTLSDTVTRIDSLLELFISPSNADRSLVNENEFKRRKASLLIEKQKAIEDLAGLDKQMDTWNDLIAKTFQFTTKAVEMFIHGTSEDKRGIVRAFGSNLTVNGNKLDITLRIPFELIQRYISQEALIQPNEKSDITIQSATALHSQSYFGETVQFWSLSLYICPIIAYQTIIFTQ